MPKIYTLLYHKTGRIHLHLHGISVNLYGRTWSTSSTHNDSILDGEVRTLPLLLKKIGMIPTKVTVEEY